MKTTGQKSSFLFNLCVAASTTQKGQMLISVACQTSENFLTDSVKFFDMDECLVYIDNIINERSYDISIIDKAISELELANRLKTKFKNVNDCDDYILMSIIQSLSKSEIARIYYKNNLFKFIEDSSYTQKIISDIMLKTSNFMNPLKLPAETEKSILELKNILMTHVQYNHMIFDPRLRLQTEPRHSVPIIDTDSNFIVIHNWVKMTKKLIENKTTVEPFRKNGKYYMGNRINSKDSLNEFDERKRFISVNTISYILYNVVNSTLDTFVANCNVEPNATGKISMKNEFYFPALLNTYAKKHYMAIYSLQEGVYLPVPELEVKGMEYLKKSYASDTATAFISDLVYNDILYPKDGLNLPKIQGKIAKFEKDIKDSIQNSEFKFLKIAKAKTEDAYADPWGEGPWKAMIVWNMLYPDKQIELPGRAYMLKVNLDKPSKFSDLSVTDPEIFHRLMEIYASEERIKKSGITAIGIPVGEEIPMWLRRYVDIDSVIMSNIKLLTPIMTALGVETIYKTSDGGYTSNIIQLG